MDEFYLAILVAIIVIVVTFIISRKFKKPRNVALLVGLSDAGKTTIFTKIIFKKPRKSVTSLKENEATMNDINLQLVDLPGADRLRAGFWDQYRDKATQIFFVVDSTTVQDKLRDICEYLYTLLSDGTIHKNKAQLFVACNKQDIENAEKKEKIKVLLEKEINAIRNVKTGQLGKTSEEEEEDYLASLPVKELTFDYLKVHFVETSMHNADQIIRLML